ncbi:hypothetical protein P879_09439 [Paragonimus westermani]|uniref:Uncharacterized protein n=1 Tax=Paragonimus westermani TaxID=34504 RepID=A0A8T0D315_9TREM|nr:hypothetical protein P879_09439 [Paragonimus westermani]
MSIPFVWLTSEQTGSAAGVCKAVLLLPSSSSSSSSWLATIVGTLLRKNAVLQCLHVAQIWPTSAMVNRNQNIRPVWRVSWCRNAAKPGPSRMATLFNIANGHEDCPVIP